MIMEEKRICRKCLLREMEGAYRQNIEKYLEVISKAERVSDEIYEERLETCKECEKLETATCEACGCYVEFRAAVEHSDCPYKKWKR